MKRKAIQLNILVVLVLCFTLLATTLAFASTDNVVTSTNNKLSSAIQEQINSAKDGNADDEKMLDDAFDVFSNADDSKNLASDPGVVLVSIEWTHNSDSAKKYYTNTALEGSSADQKFVDTYKAVTKVFTDAGKKVSEKGASVSKVKDQISGISNMANPKADLAAGQTILAPFQEPLNQAMGLIVVAAISLLGLITAMDVFYLIIPIVKSKCDSAGQAGGKMSGTTKSGEPKFRLISDDAIMAYSVAQENGKHPVWVYLGMRVKTYIAAVIVIYLLMSGNLSVIFNVILTFLGGIIEQIGSMFSKMGV